jgi:hypothetical protein
MDETLKQFITLRLSNQLQQKFKKLQIFVVKESKHKRS